MFTNMDILVFTRFGASLFLIGGLVAGFCFSKAFSIKTEGGSIARFFYGAFGVFALLYLALIVSLHNPIVGGG